MIKDITECLWSFDSSSVKEQSASLHPVPYFPRQSARAPIGIPRKSALVPIVIPRKSALVPIVIPRKIVLVPIGIPHKIAFVPIVIPRKSARASAPAKSSARPYSFKFLLSILPPA